MFRQRVLPAWMIGIVALGGFSAVGTTGLAQEETQAEERPQQEGDRDFLFGAPKGSVGAYGGWTFNRADSDIFYFIVDNLTVERNDFGAATFGFDVAIRLRPTLDAVFRVDYSHASVDSEFRDYVEVNDLPITQETRLTQVPVTAGLKLYLMAPGREVGRFAWVPRSFAPYVGAGAGLVWYRLEQEGDFVEFQDLSIFPEFFVSDGVSTTVNVFGGADFKLSPRVFLTIEALYAWADAKLSQSFVGFDPIDLTGLRTTAGVSFIF